MERIGFSLAGEGKGHAARVVALSQFLKDRFEIVYFCPEPAQGFIKKHIPNGFIVPVPALNFAQNNHGIDYWRTALDIAKTAKTLRSDINRLADRLGELEICALISDFEPYASWAAAQRDIPILNLNHPGVVLKYLSVNPGAVLAQFVATLMMPPAQQTLICSFYRGDVGPIIRQDLREARPETGDYILGYAKDSSRAQIEGVLRKINGCDFRVFPDPEADFTEALLGCRGVVAPAGHQLISESLFLGKPILAIPQLGQYEQLLNARMLQMSGRGRSGRFRSFEKNLRRFLADIDQWPWKSKGLETFRFEDDSRRAANLVQEFVLENARSVPGRRRQYNWFQTIPERLESIKGLPAKLSA